MFFLTLQLFLLSLWSPRNRKEVNICQPGSSKDMEPRTIGHCVSASEVRALVLSILGDPVSVYHCSLTQSHPAHCVRVCEAGLCISVSVCVVCCTRCSWGWDKHLEVADANGGQDLLHKIKLSTPA